MNNTTNEINHQKHAQLDLAFESIDSCNGYIDFIINKIQLLVSHINENKIDEAQSELIKVIELMDLFVQLISKVHRVIKSNFDSTIFEEESIHKLEIHMLSVIKAIFKAQEKNDIIMLSDLLEYELIDNLTQWKIIVLPELKRLKK